MYYNYTVYYSMCTIMILCINVIMSADDEGVMVANDNRLLSLMHRSEQKTTTPWHHSTGHLLDDGDESSVWNHSTGMVICCLYSRSPLGANIMDQVIHREANPLLDFLDIVASQWPCLSDAQTLCQWPMVRAWLTPWHRFRALETARCRE